MRDYSGLIFAYKAGLGLRELTENRTASSIPFGGHYRVIDFSLSSFVNAGITNIGVVMRENYMSLLDHLGSGRDWDLARKIDGLKLLPPFGYAQSSRGTARGKIDVLHDIQTYLQRRRQNYVIMTDGDLVANLPYGDIIASHENSGADITLVCSRWPAGESSDTVFCQLGPRGRVTDVMVGKEKPGYVSSLHIYIIGKQLLLDLIGRCIANGRYDWERDVILAMSEKLSLSGYLFDGYCARPTSTADYFRQNMDLLRPEVRAQLFGSPVYPKVRDEMPTYYGPDSQVRHCIVSDGCHLEGELENCILSRGVRVEKGARVVNSILMQDAVVRAGAQVSYVIADKQTEITKDRTLTGHDTYPIAISKAKVV